MHIPLLMSLNSRQPERIKTSSRSSAKFEYGLSQTFSFCFITAADDRASPFAFSTVRGGLPL